MKNPFETSKTTMSLLVALGIASLLSLSAAPIAMAETPAERKASSQSADKKLIAQKKSGATKVSGTITWQNSYNKTLQMARDSKKWVLVDVFTDWCHWCKRLDSDVYANGKIATFINKSFVCMKANAEKGDGIGVKNRYGIDGYPCTLILEPSGKEKGRINGYLPPEEFPLELTRIIQQGR